MVRGGYTFSSPDVGRSRLMASTMKRYSTGRRVGGSYSNSFISGGLNDTDEASGKPSVILQFFNYSANGDNHSTSTVVNRTGVFNSKRGLGKSQGDPYHRNHRPSGGPGGGGGGGSTTVVLDPMVEESGGRKTVDATFQDKPASKYLQGFVSASERSNKFEEMRHGSSDENHAMTKEWMKRIPATDHPVSSNQNTNASVFGGAYAWDGTRLDSHGYVQYPHTFGNTGQPPDVNTGSTKNDPRSNSERGAIAIRGAEGPAAGAGIQAVEPITGYEQLPTTPGYSFLVATYLAASRLISRPRSNNPGMGVGPPRGPDHANRRARSRVPTRDLLAIGGFTSNMESHNVDPGFGTNNTVPEGEIEPIDTFTRGA